WAGWGLLTLTLVGAYLRFRYLQTYVVWTDEDYHNARVMIYGDTVNMAAWVQQPPIYYYFSLFGRKIFGANVLGLRFFSAFLASAAVPLFYTLLLRICRSPLCALFGGIAFVVNPWLASFGCEAKPYSCAIFFSLAMLHGAYSFFARPSRGTAFSWGIGSLFFLLSIGMQPIIFMAAFTVGACGIFLLGKNFRMAVAAAAVPFAALILLMPFQRNIVANASIFMKAPNLWQFIHVDFWEMFSALGDALPDLMGSRVFAAWLEFVPLGCLAFVPLIWLAWPGKLNLNQKQKFQLACLFASFLFPVFFCTGFALIIRYTLNTRYIICYLPLLMVVFSSGVDALAGFFSGWREIPRYAMLGFWIICAGFTASYSWAVADQGKKFEEFKWKKFYEDISAEGVSGDVAFILTLNQPGVFNEEGFITTDYYYTPELRRKVALTSQWEALSQWKNNQVLIILDALERGIKPTHIFLFAPKPETQVQYPSLKYSRSAPVFKEVRELAYPTDWDAIEIKLNVSPRGAAQTLKDFLLDIEEQKPLLGARLKLYELLVGIDLIQGKCAEASVHLNTLKKVPEYDTAGTGNFLYLQARFQKACEAH
ncbi:MAG: hypothetical protein ACXWQO_08955, partial [Bdellovibrionota bacterium]